MDYESQLAEYRKRFARKEAEAKGPTAVEEEQAQENVWADEIEMPVADAMGQQMSPEMFSEDVEVPNVLTDNDDRWSDDEEMNKQAFEQYLMNDPMFQQYGPEMEAILEEVIAQASDPDNPMTEQEAVGVFIQLMEEAFGKQFKGEM